MGVFVGYIEAPHKFRVYFSSPNMIVMRRDVKFDEEKAMRFTLEQELSIPQEEELLLLRRSLKQSFRMLCNSHKWRSI